MMRLKIKQFIHSWAICMREPDILQLALARERLLKSIESYLNHYKEVKEDKFQELIHFALYRLQALPRELRFTTSSYLNGGIQREIPRLEYQQLLSCFKKHMQPPPWPTYSIWMAAATVTPIMLLFLMATFMPALALAAKKSENFHPEDTDLLCSHILKIDYTRSNLVLRDIKLQLSQMGIDYNKLPIQADFSVEKTRRHADCFAHTLTQFCEEQLDSVEEEELLNALLKDDRFMEPLHLILTYAQNTALRYKIIAKLAVTLYPDMHTAKGPNSYRLIRILGQAIMVIPVGELPPSMAENAIVRMSQVLTLYRRIAQDRSAVNRQIFYLKSILGDKRQSNVEPVMIKTSENNFLMGILLNFSVFIFIISFMQFFRKILNSLWPIAERNSPKSKISKKISPIKVHLLPKSPPAKFPLEGLSSQALRTKPPVQESLQVILAKLNELFSDLIIPNPYPLIWREWMQAKVRLELRQEKYCFFNTQGDGKIFWLSKPALQVIVKKYCEDKLEAEEQFIRLNEDAVIVEQPLSLRIKEYTHSIKRAKAPFFKILKRLANVYHPVSIQLDYSAEKFWVVFSLEEETQHLIRPDGLNAEDFMNCVYCSFDIMLEQRQNLQFSISYERIENSILHNERTFLDIKKAACSKKEEAMAIPGGFFDQSANKAVYPKVISKQVNVQKCA